MNIQMNIHKTYYVYKLLDNRPNSDTYNKVIYIGQTCLLPKRRLQAHFNIKGSQFYHWNRIYGKDCLLISVIKTIEENDKIDNKQLSLDLERKYIQLYQTNLNKQVIEYQEIHRDIKTQCTNTIVRCINTHEELTFDTACKKYNLNPNTFLKQLRNDLNIGIDENKQPLFWRVVNKQNPIRKEKNKSYYVYCISENNIPLYIGQTNNLVSRKHKHYTNINYTSALLYYYISNHSDIQFNILEECDYATAKLREKELIVKYSHKYLLFNTMHNDRYNRTIQNFCKRELNIDINNYNLNDLKRLKIHANIYSILERYILTYQKLKNIQQYIAMNKDVSDYVNRYKPVDKEYTIVIIKHNDIPCFVTYVGDTKVINLKQIYNTAPRLKQYILANKEEEFKTDIYTIVNNEVQAKDIQIRLIVELAKQYTLYNSFQCSLCDVFEANINTITDGDLSYNWFITDMFIYCMTTQTIFPSLTEAAQYAQVSKHAIAHSCKTNSYAGINSNGNRLKWTFI